MKARAHSRRARRHIAGIVAGSAFVLVLIGLMAHGFLEREALDARLCPSGGPAAQIVLLVDTTDPFTPTQRLAFAALLRELGSVHVKKGELLSVFVLGEAADPSSEPVFEMCNPGNGDHANRWTSNPEKLRKRHDERFARPLEAIVERLDATKPAQASPIMEMLQVVAINGFRRNGVSGRKRLIVVSDMMQNTASYSHYRGDNDFHRFRELPYFQRVKTDLRTVSVELRYLMHSPAIQNRKHAKFWEDYFREMGASLTAVGFLEG